MGRRLHQQALEREPTHARRRARRQDVAHVHEHADEHLDVVARAVRLLALEPAEAEEVLQRVRLGLCFVPEEARGGERVTPAHVRVQVNPVPRARSAQDVVVKRLAIMRHEQRHATARHATQQPLHATHKVALTRAGGRHEVRIRQTRADQLLPPLHRGVWVLLIAAQLSVQLSDARAVKGVERDANLCVCGGAGKARLENALIGAHVPARADGGFKVIYYNGGREAVRAHVREAPEVWAGLQPRGQGVNAAKTGAYCKRGSGSRPRSHPRPVSPAELR